MNMKFSMKFSMKFLTLNFLLPPSAFRPTPFFLPSAPRLASCPPPFQYDHSTEKRYKKSDRLDRQ
jgi:hypothetical protein